MGEFDAHHEAVESIRDCEKGLKRGVSRVISSGNGEAIVELQPMDEGCHVWTVKVSTEGWIVLSRGRPSHTVESHYETLHSLLIHESPAYKNLFGSALMEQLQALQLLQGGGEEEERRV